MHGDGQAFAAIAQDPLLARPAVIGSSTDYAYRAQRPLWGYLGWLASLGQPALVPWALAALTICSGAAATFVVALLLLRRGLNPWWALGVLIVGVAGADGLHPGARGARVPGRRPAALERPARSLGGGGAVPRGVDARVDARRRGRPRRLGAGPPAAPGRARVVACGRSPGPSWRTAPGSPSSTSGSGPSPTGRPAGDSACRARAWPPRSGHGTDPATVLAGALTAAIVTLGAVAWARDDPLTWVVVGFAGFATLLGPEVWTTDGLVRTLLPLYALGVVAGLGAWRAARRAPSNRLPSSRDSWRAGHLQPTRRHRPRRLPTSTQRESTGRHPAGSTLQPIAGLLTWVAIPMAANAGVPAEAGRTDAVIVADLDRIATLRLNRGGRHRRRAGLGR